MQPRVHRRTIEDPTVVVVEVEGDIDLHGSFEIEAAVYRGLPTSVREVILDLSRASYLDSAGVHLLLKLYKRLRSRRRQLRLVLPEHSFLYEVVELSGIASVAPIHASVSEGLASATASQQRTTLPEYD